MSDALNLAVNGLNTSAFQIAKATSSIVNASSTGSDGDLTKPLTDIAVNKINYEADAKVIRVVSEDNKTLLNILA